MSKWEDITDILKPAAIKELKAGQVLIFDYEGKPVHLKIVRNYKGKVWAKRNYIYDPDEVIVKEKV